MKEKGTEEKNMEITDDEKTKTENMIDDLVSRAKIA